MRIIERLSRFQSIAPYVVIVLFMLSVVFSSLPADPGNLAAWILCGIIGLVFLKVAFPHSYLYGLWLLTIYILAGVGVLFFNGIGLTGGQGIAIGLLVEVVAIYIIYHLIFQVKGLRDLGEGPYVPLGLWSVSVLMFFLFSNGAIAGLVTWAKTGGDLNGYLAFEGLLVLMVVFIFVKAEQCVLHIEEGAKAIRRGVAPRRRPVVPTAGTRKVPRAITRTGMRKISTKAADECIICGSELRIVSRTCPECDSIEKTAVCKGSGHVFLPCPSCGVANVHGDYRCKRCNARLDESILCKQCGTENDLIDWRRAKKGSSKKRKKKGKG